MTTSPTIETSGHDIVTVIQAYNDVTERLKRSHEALATEVCRLREELRRKNRELERRERLAALGEMAAGVAHEIRNPLGGIGLYASLLDRDLRDQPQQLDLVRRLSRGVRNLEGIVGDILEFAGDAEPRRERVRLGDVLDGVLIQAAPQADARRVEISVDESLKSVELFCDACQIERALLNLIFNALDAVSEGGRVWIRAGAEAMRNDGDAPKLFSIILEDDGPGIERESLHRIFDPFYTTKHTGTGLGLAIVHRIVESNEGRVTAGNRRGGGAVFVLLLPLAGGSGCEGTQGGD